MAEHVISRKTYALVFGALLILLAISVIVARYDLGEWNFLVAISISVAKAALIVLFFMHIWYSSALTKLVSLGALVWLGILLTMTMGDYLTRGWKSDLPVGYEPTKIDRTSHEEWVDQPNVPAQPDLER